MRRRFALLLPIIALGAPAAAQAQGAPAPTPAPPSGQITLTTQRLFGQPFLVTGSRLDVEGTLLPYVADQSVVVRFFRDGREVAIKQVPVHAAAGGGHFVARYTSPKGGTVTFSAEHAADAALGEVTQKGPVAVRYVVPNVHFGSRGATVRLLQTRLGSLHYAVPHSGVYDLGTGLAVLAFRKMTGLPRTESAGGDVFRMLSVGAGQFRVRDRHDGTHIEADLTRQVLAEIEPGGHVRAIYPISSGKPSTPTVLGHFSVYEKSPGYNSEGMYYSNYFIRGYAIHGYDPVPTYPASHGCLRVPISDAIAIYDWLQVGDPVDVYYEDDRASGPVRSNAGP